VARPLSALRCDTGRVQGPRCDDIGLEPLLDELERLEVVQRMSISRHGSIAHVSIGVTAPPDESLRRRIASTLGRFSFTLEQVRPTVVRVEGGA
jgi:hypothetical protein